ncbi:hypothetical protein BH11ACT8_BH11ACT8_23220 [soil metagenome]
MAPADYLARVDGLDLKAAGVLVMAPEGDLDATRRLNDAVLELASDGPWYAVCSVHPRDGGAAMDEIDRVAAAGAKGLKLHPNTQSFDLADPGVAMIVTKATAHGLPVLFDGFSPFDPAQPGKFVSLAMSQPDARIAIAHMHFMKFAELLVYPVLERYPQFSRNVWFDMSAVSPFFAGSPYAQQFGWVCRQLGSDRLLWASDFPFDDPVASRSAVDTYGFTDAELRAICHDNAGALYGLE